MKASSANFTEVGLLLKICFLINLFIIFFMFLGLCSPPPHQRVGSWPGGDISSTSLRVGRPLRHYLRLNGLWLQQMSSSVQIKILLPHWRVLLSGHGLPAMEHIRAVSSLFTLKSAYELRRQRFTITSKSFPFVPLRGSNPQPARFFYLLKTFHGQSKEVTL